MFFDQQEFDVRCEWGEHGVRQLTRGSCALVIVDVLSFSTCVDIAVGNGAQVYPYQWTDESAIAYAESLNAVLANFERKYETGYSLAPTSLLQIPKGTRLVLPSPNGSTLSLTAAAAVPTFAGCLRNARVVAATLSQTGRQISVIAAGEKWEDGQLRPAIEDLIGAGAIINHLPGTKSPEAEIAVAAFTHAKDNLLACLKRTGSGKELTGRGFESDLELAAALDVSSCVPHLIDGAYVKDESAGT
jgi:2-phosphosulfolactate phosphatase